jgi:hypothetical protein
VPWRGPQEPGEFPTLGYLVADWIEAHCVIPDGDKLGEPYLLTDEMLEHLVWCYRLHPGARAGDGPDAMYYRGDQLVRPQKWGKDPLNAARVCVHALGDVVFDGWDANGEPVARPHPSPWIAIAAYNETQTDNTYRPVLTMLENPRLVNTPGLDLGLAGIKLPGGVGWIDPVTSSASGKLGGRFTYVSITESGLLVGDGRTGGVTFGRVLKRNVGGMGGMWSEITNPWDPTELSLAQRTFEAKAKDVYINYRKPRRRVELNDDEGLIREIIYLYGDSVRERGGWVSAKRIRADVQDKSMGEAEVRRFFLQEITGGTRDAVTQEGWAALARKPGTDPLRPGDAVALGFDGSRSRDATSLKLCRLRDAALFRLNIWTPANYHDHRVPRQEVHRAVTNAFEAFNVHFLFADPYRWQEYLDIWSGLFPGRVVEFPTNIETRMDQALTRFLTAYTSLEFSHDDDPEANQHALNAVLVKGKRKPRREGDEAGVPEFYLSLAKKRPDDPNCLIDDFVAGVLALHARGHAIENGALVVEASYPPASARVDQATEEPGAFWRPTQRLSDLI